MTKAREAGDRARLTINKKGNAMTKENSISHRAGISRRIFLQVTGAGLVTATALGASNVDTIADFQIGSDKISLDHSIFAAISGLGSLDPNAFYAGTAAHDTDDRIIYDQASGALYYDADGSGAGAAVLFATLAGDPLIAASEFTVI